MTAKPEAPHTREARTKSSSRSESSLPRTTRASPVQPISERMIVIARYTRSGGQVDGTAALSPSHSGMVGMERSISMSRWTALSTPPPR